jgi:hypothetical protein
LGEGNGGYLFYVLHLTQGVRACECAFVVSLKSLDLENLVQISRFDMLFSIFEIDKTNLRTIFMGVVP